ncbi:MAG: hypothetical protein PHQ60_13725 [Sideroxydans sp.]|nr:hypothetical protein [Sideroxydans sp.]
MKPHRFFRALRLCLAAALLLSSLARADEASIERAIAENSIEAVDSTRDYVSQKFVGFVSGVDRFFGNERNFQEANQSVLQLDLNELMQRGGNRQASPALKAKLRLPATEERLHLLLESDPEKNVSDAEKINQTQPVSQLATPDNYGVAVRYEKPSESAWHYSSDLGIQVQTPVQPYARARLSKAIPLASWRMKIAETAFWFERTGSGETTLIDFEHALGEPALFRASSSATWMHRSQNFDLRQDFSVFHTLDEQRALHYEASAIGSSRPQRQVNDYVLSLRYRQQLNRRWLFFEINPQLHYPRESGFKPEPLLLLKLEMLFDRI